MLNYILPIEDIEDRNILNDQIEDIDSYDFKEFIEKYNFKNFIIKIIYIDDGDIKTLTRLNLNGESKTITKKFDGLKFNEENINKIIDELKIDYEDKWKEANKINTSIKLPLTLFLPSNEYDKIKLLENALDEIELVSDFYIDYFNSKNIVYKIIYNGSPKNFMNKISSKGLSIEKINESWIIK